MSLSDRRLNTLVRMAMEAEALSNDAAPGAEPMSLRLHAGTDRRHARARGRWLVGSSLALAAGIALTVAGLFVLNPGSGNLGSGDAGTPISRGSRIEHPITAPEPATTPAITPLEQRIASATPSASAPTTSVHVTPAVAGSGFGTDQNMLVVITHSPETGLHCVRWGQAEGWNAKCLPEVSEAQIRSVRLTGTCTEDRPQITRIALAGPPGSLPISDSKAQQLADCIMRSDRPCDGSGACYLSAASKCLPANVSVRIESAGEER